MPLDNVKLPPNWYQDTIKQLQDELADLNDLQIIMLGLASVLQMWKEERYDQCNTQQEAIQRELSSRAGFGLDEENTDEPDED